MVSSLLLSGARGPDARVVMATLYCLLRTLDQRASPFFDRSECLLARDGREDLVIIPGSGGLRRRLDLHEIHVVNETAILAKSSARREEVVDGHFLHLGHHRFRLVGAGGGHSAEIVTDGGINPGLRHGGHLMVSLEEPLRPGAARIVAVPVEAGDELQALRALEPDTLDV